MDYEVKRIENLCNKITDGSHFSPENDTEGVYPMYSVKDMEYNSFSLDGYKTIGKEVFEKLCKADCRPLRNDILIAKDGSYLKYVFKTKQDLDACILSSIAILRPNLNVIDPDYFVYILRTKSVKGAMANYVSGSALPRIILSDFKKMKVRIAIDHAVQHRIASILSAYDNLIENNNKRIRLLEQMAENLYKEWFVRFRFPGHEKAEFENGLPKRWRIGRLSEYGRIETGKTPSMLKQEYYGGDYLFIKTPDMHGNMFVRETEETLSEKGNLSQSKKLLPIGSIMVSCIGSGGVVAINAKQGHTNQQINSIILANTEDLEWLYFTCKTLKPMIELFGATGATMTNLSKGKFEKLKLIEPLFNLRKLFHLKTKSIFDEILKLDENIALLSRQRDLLLPRLMSGKLEV